MGEQVTAPPNYPEPLVPSRRTAGFWWLVAMMCLALSGLGTAQVADPDLFWHLRVADELSRAGVGPIVDTLSYNSSPEPWHPYSWLAELGMAAAWNMMGPGVLLVAPVLARLAFSFALGWACLTATRDEAGLPDPTRAALVTLPAVVVAAAFFTFRPVDFALVLLALSQALAWRDRRRESRAIWLLPALAALCVNVHLYAIFLPVVALLHWAAAPSRRNAFVLALTVVSCLMTPLLPGVFGAALHYQAADPMVAGGHITEMQAFWEGEWAWVFVPIVLIVAGIVVWKRRELRPGDWLALGFAAVVVFKFARFVPVAAVFATPVIARLLPATRAGLLERATTVRGLACASAILAAITAWRWDEQSASEAMMPYPVTAAAWVEANVTPRRGRIVNEFDWGGYLAWRLGDDYRVFVDGRTQVHPASFWQAAYLDADAPTRVLVGHDADVAVLPAKGSFFAETLRGDGWRVAYEDEVAQVLLPGEIDPGQLAHAD